MSEVVPEQIDVVRQLGSDDKYQRSAAAFTLMQRPEVRQALEQTNVEDDLGLEPVEE